MQRFQPSIRQTEVFTEAAKRFSRDHLKVPERQSNRLGTEKLFRSLAGLTPKQLEIHNDTNKYIAMCCTRRAGKTYLAAPWMVELGMTAKDPEATMFFIAPTLQHAKALLWRRFEAVRRETQLEFAMKADPWRVEFPTGAILYFRGASDLTELGAVVGFKTCMVWVDECQDIPDGVLRYIAQKVGPGLRDLGGKMVYSGTPGLVCQGHWYDVATGQPGESHWSRHFFTLYDNPHLPPEAKDLNVILKEEGLTPELPRFKREYMGQWVEDDSLQVYKFDIVRNGNWEFGKPLPDNHDWSYVMGVDWGYSPDPSAVVVLAYARTCKTVYVVYEWQEPKCIYEQVYKKGIKPALEKYGIMPSFADAAAPQAIEEMNQRFGMGMQPCTKGNKSKLKAHFVELANSHLLQGEVQLPLESRLSKELLTLVWDPKKLPERKEHPGKPNHSADAFLYALIECKQWNETTTQVEASPYDVDNPDSKAAYLLRLAAQQSNRNKAIDWANDADWHSGEW